MNAKVWVLGDAVVDLLLLQGMTHVAAKRVTADAADTGLGTVGSGVYETLCRNHSLLEAQVV